MRRRWRVVVLLCSWMLLGVLPISIANAEEPYLDFIHGLRDQRHFDFALTYLEQLEASTDVPPEIRELIPYERGMTLLEQARQMTNLDRQREFLDRATAALEQFANNSPQHELAGQANTDRALILLEKARVELWKSEEPANEANVEAFRQRAREQIAQARGVFQTAFEQHQAEFEQFPIFIPEDQIQQREAREAAEARFLQAKLYLAQCTYWLAKTYAEDSVEYRDTLTQASIEFEEIHTAHRQQTVGLYARLWQGKCFEEQDELGAAIGIYDQFLNNPGTSSLMVQLKSTALRFKLICLNHELRNDFQNAAQLAEQWLDSPDTRLLRRTSVGLGIAYERARALEGYALTLPEGDSSRNNALNQALGLARSINVFPGEFKAATSRMIQRLMLALNRDPSEPQDFESAFGLGSEFLDDVETLGREIEQIQASGDRSELEAKIESMRAAAAEMTRLFDLAIRLADSSTDSRLFQLAHMRLAYGYISQQKYYEAAAISEYLMQKRAEDYPELAVECGYLAVMAYDNAYIQAPADDREFEAERLLEMASMVEELFPDSARANDARSTIAKVYYNQGDYVAAAEWFNRVPPSAEDYGEAQLRVGQCYWLAYNDTLQLDESDRPAEADSWLQLAESHLTTGVSESQLIVPQDAATPETLTQGKLSLATLRNLKGVYTTQGEVVGAIELLTTEPHSVVSAIQVQPGATRPAEGVRSPNIASFALQQLLRAQIGAASEAEGDVRQQLMDASANTRVLLEELAAEGGDQGALTQIYISFGAQLQKELSQIEESGDLDRLREVRESFESFLNDVADRQEGQNLSSLVWIAETFAALGESAADDPAKSQSYFTRSARTYETMLNRALNEPGFVENQDQTIGIRLSLARTHRRAKDFPAAEATLNEVIKSHPNALNVQQEAALLYEEWGESGARDMFQIAIHGRQTEPVVWGWGRICVTLQRSMEQQPGVTEVRLAYLDAKVHQFNCLLGYGDDSSLGNAKFGLESLVLTFDQSVLSERMEDFEQQYTEVLTKMGVPRQPLSEVSSTSAPPSQGNGGSTATATSGAGAGPSRTPAASGGTNWGLIIGMLVIGIGLVVGLCYLSIGQNRRRHRAVAAQASATTKQSRSRSAAQR